jgi:dihydroxyacetone kinase-like predicted kinase
VNSKAALKSIILALTLKCMLESIWDWDHFNVKTAVNSTFPNGTWQSTKKKDAINLKDWKILNQSFRLTTMMKKKIKILNLKMLNIQKEILMILWTKR